MTIWMCCTAKPKHTAGFTLPEVMVTVVISVLTAMAAGSIIVWVTGLTLFISEKNTAQNNLLQAAYRLKATVALAVNVGSTGAAGVPFCKLANPSLQGGGCFTNAYNIGGALLTAGNLNGQVDTLARFYREGGTQAGQMLETSIFFRRPDITAAYDDGSYPSGALYFSTITPTAAGVPILIGPDSIIIDHMTGITVQTSTVVDSIGAPLLNRAKSTTFTLTGRYYLSGRSAQWLYCPAGTCAPSASYKDETTSVTSNFIDNVLHVGVTAGDVHPLNTLYGNIYFLQTQMPTAP